MILTDRQTDGRTDRQTGHVRLQEAASLSSRIACNSFDL